MLHILIQGFKSPKRYPKVSWVDLVFSSEALHLLAEMVGVRTLHATSYITTTAFDLIRQEFQSYAVMIRESEKTR